MTATLILTVIVPFNWSAVPGEVYWIIGLMAVTSSTSHTMMILAMTKARAGSLAPFTYSEIAWAAILGLVMFGTLPDMWSWIGIAMIVLCGVAVARAQGRAGPKRNPKV